MYSMVHKFAIPTNTLHNHLLGKSSKFGAESAMVLTTCEDRESLTCMNLADMGYCLTREVVGGIVRDYLHENAIQNPFTDRVPGKDWWQRFLKWWPCISE